MTGLTYMAVELNGKRLELLREMAPSIRRVALLANPAYPGESGERANSVSTAGRIGFDVRYVGARTADELKAGIREDGRRQGAGDLAARRQLHGAEPRQHHGVRDRAEHPGGVELAVFAEAGALCTHGPRLADSYRRLAYYADRVLRGTKPADLPIEQPTTIETIVNLKTADALG
jgi:putative ABC transport system substrate-binding protein